MLKTRVVLDIVDYPDTLDIDWLREVRESVEDVEFSFYIDPVPKNVSLKRLRKRIIQLESNMYSVLEVAVHNAKRNPDKLINLIVNNQLDRLVPEEDKRKFLDAREILEAIQQDKTQLFGFSAQLGVEEEIADRVEDMLGSKMIVVRRRVFDHDALRNFDTEALSTILPFRSQLSPGELVCYDGEVLVVTGQNDSVEDFKEFLRGLSFPVRIIIQKRGDVTNGFVIVRNNPGEVALALFKMGLEVQGFKRQNIL